MKGIAFSSDHHYSNLYPQFAKYGEKGINRRLAEMLAVEDRLHEAMVSHFIDIHIRVGDLYDKKNSVDAVTEAEVTKRIAKNKAVGIEEIILRGNHDVAMGGVRSTLESIKEANLAHIVGDANQGHIFAPTDNVRIYMLPYTDDGEVLRSALRRLPHKKPDCFNILVLHATLEGAKTGSEFPLPYQLSKKDLHTRKWDLIICGHTHEPQQDGKIWTVGSLCQRSFADEGSQRSWLRFDVEKLDLNRIPILGPRFHTVTLTKEPDLKVLTSELARIQASPLYARIVAKVRVDWEAIGPVLDTYTAGWVPLPYYDPEEKSKTARLEAESNWRDIFQSYIETAAKDTGLDPKELLDYGLEVLEKAVPQHGRAD